jgi:predicted transcriptional regulator
MEYRLYLIDAKNRIRAAESFVADGELEAKEIATAIYESCYASFDCIELWQGARVVMRKFSSDIITTGDLWTLIAKRQESVAQVEEAMERSFACIRESEQLMTTLGMIREG